MPVGGMRYSPIARSDTSSNLATASKEWTFLPGIKIRPLVIMCITEFWLKNISAYFFPMLSFPFEKNFQCVFLRQLKRKPANVFLTESQKTFLLRKNWIIREVWKTRFLTQCNVYNAIYIFSPNPWPWNFPFHGSKWLARQPVIQSGSIFFPIGTCSYKCVTKTGLGR